MAVVTGGPWRLPTASDGLSPQPQPEGAGERGGTASLLSEGEHVSGLLDELRGRQRAGSGAHAHAAAAQRLLGLPGALSEREAPLLVARGGLSGAPPMASAAGTGEAGLLAGAADALETVDCGAAAVLAVAGCCAGLGRGGGRARRGRSGRGAGPGASAAALRTPRLLSEVHTLAV